MQNDPRNHMIQIPAGQLAAILVLICVLLALSQFLQGVNKALADQLQNNDICYVQHVGDKPSQDCLDKRFNDCVISEKYSRLECAAMVGGQNFDSK